MAPERNEQVVWEGRPSLLMELPLALLLVAGAALATWGLLYVLPEAERGRQGAQADAVFGWVIVGTWVLVVGLVLARMVTHLATRYVLTNQRLRITRGVLSTTTHDMELRRIRDSTVQRTAVSRLFGLGDVRLVSGDQSTPRLTLTGVRHPYQVQDELRQLVEERIRTQGVREIDILR